MVDLTGFGIIAIVGFALAAILVSHWFLLGFVVLGLMFALGH